MVAGVELLAQSPLRRRVQVKGLSDPDSEKAAVDRKWMDGQTLHHRAAGSSLDGIFFFLLGGQDNNLMWSEAKL